MNDRLPQIAGVFGMASLLSFGGANAIVPQLQLESVDRYAWLSDRQFADCFAIAQVTPGPSTLLVTLLGYRAGGVSGALVATLAMCIPSAIIVYIFTRFWLTSGKAKWHVALEHGMAPVGIGLVAAAGVIVARAVDHGPVGWGLTFAAAGALAATNVNPLFVVAAGGAAGLLLGGA